MDNPLGIGCVPAWRGYDDPCDEMVSVRQVMDLLLRDTIAIELHGRNYYDRAAAILGLPRDEAKRLIYKECYSG